MMLAAILTGLISCSSQGFGWNCQDGGNWHSADNIGGVHWWESDLGGPFAIDVVTVRPRASGTNGNCLNAAIELDGVRVVEDRCTAPIAMGGRVARRVRVVWLAGVCQAEPCDAATEGIVIEGRPVEAGPCDPYAATRVGCEGTVAPLSQRGALAPVMGWDCPPGWVDEQAGREEPGQPNPPLLGFRLYRGAESLHTFWCVYEWRVDEETGEFYRYKSCPKGAAVGRYTEAEGVVESFTVRAFNVFGESGASPVLDVCLPVYYRP
jgi:hypothetical protein